MLAFRFRAKASYQRAVRECEEATEALTVLNDKLSRHNGTLRVHFVDVDVPGAGRRVAERMSASS